MSRVDMPNSSRESGQHGGHAVHAGFQRHSAGQVGLRIQHDFGVPDARNSSPGEVGTGHVGEVLLRLQHGHVGVVQVQEGLQVGELIACAQLVQVRIGKLDSVPFRQGEDQLRFQRPLDVEVQLRHRQQLAGFFGNGFFGFSLSGLRALGFRELDPRLFLGGYGSIAEC